MSNATIEKVRELIDNQNKLVTKVKEIETNMLAEKEEQKIQERINAAVKVAIDKVEGTETPTTEPVKSKPKKE